MATTLGSAGSLPAGRLTAYLRRHFPEREDLAVQEVLRLPGGASRETWAYRATWRDGETPVDRRFILRRDPPASLVVTEREMEYRVLVAARRAGLPVAAVECLELDPVWLERPFLILERVSGTASRPALFSDRNAAARPKLARQFIEWLAYLHRQDWRALGLGFLGEPDLGVDAARRQVDHWAGLLDQDALEQHVVLRETVRWLRRNLPATDRIVWLHGDYRAGNIMFQEDRLVSLLDWELSHLGDPLQDVGWASMEFWGNQGLVGGMIDRTAFWRGYEALSGIPVDPQRAFFYEVLGNLKMAVVALGGVRAYCDGRTPEPLMAYLGCLPPALEQSLVRQLGW